MKCIILGTAYPYRGGLASYNERLARELNQHNIQTEIFTFTLQYPNILFPGKTQYSSSPPPADVIIKRKVNSIDRFNWIKVGHEIKKLKPDILIIKYWMPFMAPCFGTIARIAKRNNHTKVICIADNIIPHERKFYDKVFTKFFLKQVDGVVVMSDSVKQDLKKFDPDKPVVFSPHPLFDNFGNTISKEEACRNLNLDPQFNYILFFGFVRDYKGLDLLLHALALLVGYPQQHRVALPLPLLVADQQLKLIIAGEYYTNEKQYQDLIKKLNLQDRVIQFNKFIPDEEVANYFCASDLVVQPYKQATQSGVTQIAYHFEIPMIVTNVGGLPEMVPDGKVGYVVKPDSKAIADSIVDFYQGNKKQEFVQNIKEEKKRFGWDEMVMRILQVYSMF